MTIKDLARETGYSVGTISRVLNHHPNVSEKARREVTAAVDRFGFERNENAKNLKRRRGDSILVLVKGRKNELFASLIERLQQYFLNTRYTLLLDYFDEGENEVRRAIHLCAEKKPLGLLFLGGNCDNFEPDFAQITIPAVLLTDNASGLPFPNLSSVFTDDTAAADDAVSYLIAQGHRRIGIIGGDPECSDTSRMRLQGSRNAMHRAGIASEVAYGRNLYSYDGGYQAMQELLLQKADITAVFAMADVMAIGAMRALRDVGLRVPEDISVLGFDGLQIGSYFLPKLTTVHQSVELLADRAAKFLVENIEKGVRSRHENVPFTMDLRESVIPAI